MKLSELTYSYLCSIGLTKAHIPTDCSDALRYFWSQTQFDKAKQDLFDNYGDVELIISPEAEAWFDKIKIDDAKWQRDYDKYCADKAAWYAKSGSN
jgi:hypothetical protein